MKIEIYALAEKKKRKRREKEEKKGNRYEKGLSR